MVHASEGDTKCKSASPAPEYQGHRTAVTGHQKGEMATSTPTAEESTPVEPAGESQDERG